MKNYRLQRRKKDNIFFSAYNLLWDSQNNPLCTSCKIIMQERQRSFDTWNLYCPQCKTYYDIKTNSSHTRLSQMKDSLKLKKS